MGKIFGHTNISKPASVEVTANIQPAPATSRRAIPVIEEKVGGTHIIPPDQRMVRIKNVGPEKNGLPVVMQINGEDLSVGNIFPFDGGFDHVNNQEILSPTITINTNGGTVWYKYY